MALTGKRLGELHREELRKLSVDRAHAGRTAGPTSRGPGPRIRSGAHWGLLGAWVVFTAVAIAIEPAPSRPHAAAPLWADLWNTAMVGALVATGVGLARRHRAGFVASAVAGGVALFGAVMCPVSGHHVVGSWWFVQMAGFAALGAVSLAALRMSRSHP